MKSKENSVHPSALRDNKTCKTNEASCGIKCNHLWIYKKNEGVKGLSSLLTSAVYLNISKTPMICFEVSTRKAKL
jgi:hypothetical protein